MIAPGLLKKYTTRHSRFLALDGTLLHYRIQGEGKPLLLLHGMFSSLHTYNAWVAELQDEFQLIRLDLPGFGLSAAQPDVDYDIAYCVEMIDQFCELIGLEQLSIIGHSLGGWIAWEYALRFPEKVNKMVLVSSAGFVARENTPSIVNLIRKTPFKQLYKLALNRAAIEDQLKEVYVDHSMLDEALINRYVDLITAKGNPEALYKLLRSDYQDRTAFLEEIATETLILWGDTDKWLPTNNAYRFQLGLQNAETVIFEGVGHVPMEECSKESAELIRSFI